MRKTENGLITLKLRDGEDVLEGLKERIEDHGIRSGLILSGIGMMRELTLGYFKGEGEYEKLRVNGPVELTSMQGNIGMSEDGLPIGIQFLGKPFDEGAILRTAFALEQVRKVENSN